jgi:hypothetical protein
MYTHGFSVSTMFGTPFEPRNFTAPVMRDHQGRLSGEHCANGRLTWATLLMRILRDVQFSVTMETYGAHPADAMRSTDRARPHTRPTSGTPKIQRLDCLAPNLLSIRLTHDGVIGVIPARQRLETVLLASRQRVLNKATIDGLPSQNSAASTPRCWAGFMSTCRKTRT